MSKVQQTAWRCANEYWTQLSQDIQTAAITGNNKGMFDDIKLGPTQSKTTPLKSSSADMSTVTDSPYLLRFGGTKYGVTAMLQIIRQRAVSVKTNYYTITQQMAPLPDA